MAPFLLDRGAQALDHDDSQTLEGVLHLGVVVLWALWFLL